MRFFFTIHDCDEPPHAQVQAGRAIAKFWLDPVVELDENHGLNSTEARTAERILRRRAGECLVRQAMEARYMSHTEQHATLERYVEAIRDQDASALGEIFADDVRVEWPQSGERFTGKEACVRVYTSYPGGSPELVGEPSLMGSGDLWVAQASIRYPDGTTYLSVGIFEFENGKIAHEVDYFAPPFPVPDWRRGWADSD